MASDKEAALARGNFYVDKIASAKQSCKSACLGISSSITSVGFGWKGDAGAAMGQALANVQQDLLRACRQLESAEAQLRSRVRSIYNDWPEEEEVSPGG